jgi:hypothetical protein
VQEQNRLDAEIGPVLSEIESRGARATFGYDSTLALLHDVAHVSLSAGKKLLDRDRAVNPTHTVDGSTVSARAPHTGAAAREGAIGPGQVDAILTVLTALPDTVTEEDRDGAEKILVDLARETGPREIHRAGQAPSTDSTPTAPHPRPHPGTGCGNCICGPSGTAAWNSPVPSMWRPRPAPAPSSPPPEPGTALTSSS